MSDEILDNLKNVLLNLSAYLMSQSSDPVIEAERKDTLDKEVGDLIERYKELKEINYVISDEELEDTITRANQLVDTIQAKLTSNEFVGAQGTSITNVQNINNQLVITDSTNKVYNLGNFVNDFSNLVNSPEVLRIDNIDVSGLSEYQFSLPTYYTYDLYICVGGYFNSTSGATQKTYLVNALWGYPATVANAPIIEKESYNYYIVGVPFSLESLFNGNFKIVFDVDPSLSGLRLSLLAVRRNFLPVF